MRTRTCPECQLPTESIRQRRHPECKRDADARAKREKRAAERGETLDDQVERDGFVLVDMMKSSSRPPSFAGVTYPARDDGDDEVFDYTTPDAAPRFGRTKDLDYSKVPASARKDRHRAAMLARQIADEDAEPEVTSWGEMLQAGQETKTVDFTRQVTSPRERPQHAITNPAAAGQLYGVTDDYRAAAAGQSVRRHVPRQNRGPQKHPHILQG